MKALRTISTILLASVFAVSLGLVDSSVAVAAPANNGPSDFQDQPNDPWTPDDFKNPEGGDDPWTPDDFKNPEGGDGPGEPGPGEPGVDPGNDPGTQVTGEPGGQLDVEPGVDRPVRARPNFTG